MMCAIGVVGVGASPKNGAVVEGNKLKIDVEAHQTIGYLKMLIAAASGGLKAGFELQAHGAKDRKAYEDSMVLLDCGLVSGSAVQVIVELLEIFFVLPRGVYR